MAKRKDIEAILEDESLDSKIKVTRILDIIHSEVDTVKDERDSLQEQLETANKDLESAKSAKEKAESDLTTYRSEQSAKESRSAKESAYAKLLKDAGVGDKHHKLILKVADLDKVELADDGSVKNSDDIIKSIKSEFADYVSATRTEGARFENHPHGQGASKMSKDDIMKISDTAERQKAIAENHELFGF